MAENPNQPKTPAAVGPPAAPETPPKAPENQPATPAVDVQAEIEKATEAQQAAFTAQLKELTGHDSLESFKQAQLKEQGKTQELLDAKTAEAAKHLENFEKAQIRAAILGAAADAVDPQTLMALLAPGAAVADDGTVTIGGKPVLDAAAQLLKDKPFLAKPQGGPGSGSPQNPGGAAANPWSKEHFNLTEQARITRENPAEAERLRASAAA